MSYSIKTVKLINFINTNIPNQINSNKNYTCVVLNNLLNIIKFESIIFSFIFSI